MPTEMHKRDLLLTARTLVLIDDEASTGNTFLNLSNAVRALNPNIARVHLATVTNFMGQAATEALSARFGVTTSMAAPLSGEYQFIPGDVPTEGPPAQRYDATADRGASGVFGRFGLDRALRVPGGLVARLAAGVQPGQRVLVLGTGEFMHASYMLGAGLEAAGLDVVVQSTTRSPILKWGSVSAALAFPDNYGEGVTNFLYNVTPGMYDHVFICHETAPNAALRWWVRVLSTGMAASLSISSVTSDDSG